MVRAERNNVPVSRTALLHMGTHLGFLHATFFRAVRWNRLTAEILPVIKPASATASIIARSVDVGYSHTNCTVKLVLCPRRPYGLFRSSGYYNLMPRGFICQLCQGLWITSCKKLTKGLY